MRGVRRERVKSIVYRHLLDFFFPLEFNLLLLSCCICLQGSLSIVLVAEESAVDFLSTDLDGVVVLSNLARLDLSYDLARQQFEQGISL